MTVAFSEMTEEEVARILGRLRAALRKAKLTEEEKRAAVNATPGYTVSDVADVAITIKARFAKGTLQYFCVSKREVT